MSKITENEIKTLKGVIAQARPDEWTDFPGNGKSQRTHIGYLMGTTIGEAQVPLFETNTNAKRADVLLAIYARNYLPRLLDELIAVRSLSRWIPVSETLPEPDQHVMIYRVEGGDGFVDTGFYHAQDTTPAHWASADGEYPLDVSHWMPLPLSPTT